LSKALRENGQFLDGSSMGFDRMVRLVQTAQF
jgi:hypothetical protein